MVYDLVVIGGGPAGYVGAIRAAQLGKKVLCVDKERAGGTCLNWGCIPTKALLKSAELYRHVQHAEDYGFSVKGLQHDYAAIIQRSRGVADRMAKGVEFLLKSKKVDYLAGQASLTKNRNVRVKGADGKEQIIEARHVLVCTGTVAKRLTGLEVDGKRVMTSREALANTHQPKSLLILGAGAIGVEFAYFFNAFGTKVTLIEMKPQVLPVEDHEVADHLGKSFQKAGIDVLLECRMEKMEAGKNGVKLTLSGKRNDTLEAEALLVAVGVEANLAGLLENGVEMELDRGYVKTSGRYETSIKNVYAAGDVIGPPWLAHVASHEAIEAVEGIFVPGKVPHKIAVFPGCTYCQPQVASVGLTENAAKEKKLKFKAVKFPYRASGKAVAAGEPEGFVKLIVGEPHGEILGAHLIGAEATELIAELGLAMQLEATIDEIRATIHAHPTLSEMVAEAAHVAAGAPLHI